MDTSGTVKAGMDQIFKNALAKSGATAFAAVDPNDGILVVGDHPDYEEIDGSKVVLQFEIPHTGWEMDNAGWITEDGRAWETSHGTCPIEMTPQELAELDERVDAWARGVHAAREVSQVHRAGANTEEIGGGDDA